MAQNRFTRWGAGGDFLTPRERLELSKWGAVRDRAAKAAKGAATGVVDTVRSKTSEPYRQSKQAALDKAQSLRDDAVKAARNANTEFQSRMQKTADEAARLRGTPGIEVAETFSDAPGIEVGDATEADWKRAQRAQKIEGLKGAYNERVGQARDWMNEKYQSARQGIGDAVEEAQRRTVGTVYDQADAARTARGQGYQQRYMEGLRARAEADRLRGFDPRFGGSDAPPPPNDPPKAGAAPDAPEPPKAGPATQADQMQKTKANAKGRVQKYRERLGNFVKGEKTPTDKVTDTIKAVQKGGLRRGIGKLARGAGVLGAAVNTIQTGMDAADGTQSRRGSQLTGLEEGASVQNDLINNAVGLAAGFVPNYDDIVSGKSERIGENIVGAETDGSFWRDAGIRAVGGLVNQLPDFVVDALGGFDDYDPNADVQQPTRRAPSAGLRGEPASTASWMNGGRTNAAGGLSTAGAAGTGANFNQTSGVASPQTSVTEDVMSEVDPTFSGYRPGAGRVEEPIGFDGRGTPIFQDGNNSFSDRGILSPMGYSQGTRPDFEGATRALQDLRTAQEAASMGMSTDAWQTMKDAEKIRQLSRAGLKDNAMYEFIRSGGLRGGVAGAGPMDFGDQIKYADLLRKQGNDEFNREARMAELDAQTRDYNLRLQDAMRSGNRDAWDQLMDIEGRKQKLEEFRLSASKESRQVVNDVVDQLSNPETQDLGYARAQQIVADNPDSPEAEAILNWAVTNPIGTGFIDRLLRLGFSMKPPSSWADAKGNYQLVNGMYVDELRGNNGRNFTGVNYDPRAARIIATGLNRG